MAQKFYQSINDHYDDIFPLNQSQVDFVRCEIPDPASNLLEVGCANGKLTDALSDYEISGIDLESSFVDEAKKRYPYVDFMTLNMLDIDRLDAHYEGIVCFGNTLVHIDKPSIKIFISKCFEKLNDGGKILIQILHYDHILNDTVVDLPLIENKKIKFERYYEHSDPFLFKTKLTVKETSQTMINSVTLTPILSNTLASFLSNSGFKDIQLYGDFMKNPLTEKSLPLVISATKK